MPYNIKVFVFSLDFSLSAQSLAAEDCIVSNLRYIYKLAEIAENFATNEETIKNQDSHRFYEKIIESETT
jgi:hypothetical protein